MPKPSDDTNTDLIEVIARECGCTYISDLHDNCTKDRLKQVLGNDKLSAYPLNQWRNFAEYITGFRPELDSIEAMKKYILEKI